MRTYFFALSFSLFMVFYSCSDDSGTLEVPDTTAPKVGLSISGFSTSGGEAIVVGGQINVNVEAEDAGGIAIIEAFINDEKVGEAKTPPYSITIDLTSFTSKTSKSQEFIYYVLKVVATDIAGNTTSIEQIINIDNEMPTIKAVSLKEGEVVGGNAYNVLFEVEDNDEISSVSVYINESLSTVLTDENYALNLDTSVLADGENTLKIEAKDVAGNTGLYVVNFIVDNTGPEMTVGSLKQEQLLDEPISLNPIVTDTYSDVISVEIYVGDELVHSTADSSAIIYTLDPNQFPTGETTVKILSEDSLGNSSEMVWSVEVVRLLLKLTIPDGYLSPNIHSNHFVFASQLDGRLIDIKEIIFETREVRLYADEAFDIQKDFTVTFASLGKNGVASYLVSISHVNRQNLGELNLTVPKRYSGKGAKYYPINGFSETTRLFCFGRDYYFSSSEAGDTLIQDFGPSNHGTESGPIYIYGYNPVNNFYNYQFVDRPIDPNFEMNFSDFSEDNLVERPLSATPADYLNNSRSLSLYGFLTQEDLENNLFHQIWSYGYGQNVSSPLDYKLNTRFYGYAHDLIIGNYRSKGAGLPPEVALVPDWTIDYTFLNNSLSLTKSGTGHIVGELYLEGGYNVGAPYVWDMFFDSNMDGDIVLPNIPEALQEYPIYSLYQENNLEPGRVGLRRYDNRDSYNDFLEFVIKPSQAFQRSAPRYESIFSGTQQAYLNTGYFYNWW